MIEVERTAAGLRTRRPLMWILAFIAATALVAAFAESLVSSPRWAATAALAVACASVVALATARPGRPISLGSVYALLLALFHTGLLMPMALGLPLELLYPSDEQWVRTDAFARSTVYVALAQCALTIGYLAAARVGTFTEVAKPRPDPTPAPSDRAGVIGIALFAVGAVLWVYYALHSGVDLLGSSYLQFLAATRETPMPVAYLLMGFGIPVSAASRNANARLLALVLFAVWSFPAFTLGLRGEVIIPAAAYVVVAARRRQIPLRPWMAAAAVAVVAAGSAVRAIRQYGLGGAGTSLASANPLIGLTELGYSIRPLVVVVGYRARGEGFVGYGTYVAPFRRVFIGRLLGGDTLSVAEDPTVFSTMIATRVGTIGGSVTAEAYRSAGVLAIVLVLFLVGLALARIDRGQSSLLSDCMAGMIAFSFFLWIRNDFTPVPVQLAFAGALLLVMWTLQRRSHPTSRARRMAIE